jgi:hypothetical protein
LRLANHMHFCHTFKCVSRSDTLLVPFLLRVASPHNLEWRTVDIERFLRIYCLSVKRTRRGVLLLSNIMADALEMATRDFRCVSSGTALFDVFVYGLTVIVGECKAEERKERSPRNLF